MYESILDKFAIEVHDFKGLSKSITLKTKMTYCKQELLNYPFLSEVKLKIAVSSIQNLVHLICLGRENCRKLTLPTDDIKYRDRIEDLKDYIPG